MWRPFSQVSGHLFAVYANLSEIDGSGVATETGSWKAGPATQSARVSSAPPVLSTGSD
jgi:hypothetical protein